MPEPLRWDTPGLRFDSGLKWDGMATPKRKTMNNTKAVIDFSAYTAAELGPIAHAIHDDMTTNAATFASPPVTMTALQTQITDYDTKLIDKASQATADLIAFNDARDDLEETLGTLGNYVNSVAKGDAMTVEQSGFPSYETARAADTSPPDAPADLRLKQGKLSCTLTARYKPNRTHSTNEVQANIGDPNNEAQWLTKGIYQGGRADLDGFAPGILVWVRVRTVGLKGVMGAWSDPAQIRVI